MSRSSRRLAVLVAAVALAAGGCASQDVDGEDAASVLDDAGAPEAVQTCVGDGIDELDQDQRNEVGKADTLSELPDDLQETVEAMLDECVAGESATGDSESEGGSDEGDSDSSETTETTEADAGTTTTTSAPG
jgi:hypothetical protein